MSIFTSVIKCGICGEPLSGSGSPYTCAVCGNVSYASNPMLEDELRTANAMRECTRFDEAMLVYKQIVKKYKTDDLSEVYWNLLLCEQRVMFETDEKGERFPSFYAITDDEIEDSLYYLGAIGSAEKHAPERVEIFKGLAEKMIRAKQLYARISETSKPYDLFICFKKSTFEGGDTKDCALAIDLYNHLAKDYNIFFSERSLKNVVVREFEPNIYYGLYTAKVMLVLCSKKEYVESQWVKNEWSRFHAFAQNPATGKTIIPIFLEDFSPRSLPSELISYQGLSADYHLFDELGKTLRKIIKPVDMEAELKRQLAEQQRQMQEQLEAMRRTQRQASSAAPGAPSNDIAPLLRRAFMFAEDKKWDSANEYFEKVLDRDPENADAYLGNLMVEMKVTRQEQLRDCAEPFDRSFNYQKAVRFADAGLKATLGGYIEHIKERKAKEEAARKRAEEEARKRAEEARKRAEEEKKKCDLLFQEYKAAYKNERSGVNKKAEAERKLSALTGQRDGLLTLKNSWQGIEEELTSLGQKAASVQAEIETLNNERANLGFFAGKRKKEIAERLRALKNEKRTVTQGTEAAQKKKQGYHTASEVDEALNAILQQISEQRRKVLKTSLTIREELSTYEAGKALLQKFDASLDLKKGASVKFGTYAQDKSNTKKPIEWQVLDVQEGKALVISKYGLDCKRYHSTDKRVTWETCSLRQWLNNDFVNTAFSAEERAMIPTVTVAAYKNPSYSTDPGNATQDKVFLLSIPEVKKYFSSDGARQCKPTDYAVANGAYRDSANGNGNGNWWLRSPGHNRDCAALVDVYGVVYENGWTVYYDKCSVRPALWIDLIAYFCEL